MVLLKMSYESDSVGYYSGAMLIGCIWKETLNSVLDYPNKILNKTPIGVKVLEARNKEHKLPSLWLFHSKINGSET